MAETHSLTPMYASQSHNYSFNFCCKVSGNQTLFFNNLKKTKVLLTKVKTRSELYYRADRTDESLQLSVGIQFQSYLPLLSFVQISSNFWNLLRIFTWVGEVLKSLPECLSVAPAHQAARWHWLALTGSVLCLRPRLRAPSVPALSRLRLRPSAPALTLRSPHWHRLDTTGSMIISQLGFSRNCSVIILSCQQRISTISLSFC